MKSLVTLITGITIALVIYRFSSSSGPSSVETSIMACDHPDYDALMALYNATNGPNWTNSTGWGDTCDVCQWYGVSCSGGRVRSLILSDNGLVGNIPSEIGNLSNLDFLSLGINSGLAGIIPPEIGNLTNLVHLLLYNSDLNGELPTTIGNLASLRQLRVSSNNLSGNIPTSIGDLSSLRFLHLFGNNFTGKIPEEIGQCSNLSSIHLGTNNLSGTIPNSIQNLSNLSSIAVNDNQIVGPVLHLFSDLTNLVSINLNNNLISDTLPPALSHLTLLKHLFVENNMIYGEIPSEWSTMPSLENVLLSENMLSGCFPPEFSALCSQTFIAVYRNPCFLGTTLGSWCSNNLECPADHTLTADNEMICIGGNSNLTTTGGSSFSWSTGETTSSISVSPIQDSWYYLTLTTTQGCTRHDSIQIVVNAPPIVTINGSDVTVNGGSDGSATTDVSGGQPPYQYLWNTGSTEAQLLNIPAGDYSVIVTDANGCADTAIITISEPACLPAGTSCDDGNPNTFDDVEDGNCGCAGTPCPTINPNLTFTSISCFGDQDGTASVAPAGGVEPYDILWSTAETSLSVSNLAMGEHSVIVTDANGCADTTAFSITEPPQLTASVIGTDESLPGQLDGAVDLTVAGGTPPLSFLWSNGATTEDISGLEGNGITYSVMVTDANGCQVSASTTLQTGCLPAGTSCDDGNPNTFDDVEDGNCGCAGTPCPTINPNLTFTSISCFGDQDGTASVAPAGGVGPYDILWSTAETTTSISNLTMGDHSVIVTDANGCADTTSFSITEPAQLTASVIGTDESLPGQLDGAVDLTVAGGTPPLSFLWSNGATTEDISGLEGNGITYSVMVTDANGCQVSASTTLQTGCLPAGTSCDDGNPNTFDDVEDGNCGCAGTPCPTINPNLTFTSISCFGDQDGTASVAPSGGVEPYDILWSTAETTTSISNLAMGEHSVIITDANGCADTTSFSITEPPQLTVSVIGTDESLPGQLDGAVDLTVAGGTPPLSFLWSNGATTEDISGLEGNGITYSVMVTDANGCQVSASTTLQTGCHPAGTSCDDGNPNTFDDVEDGNCGCAGTPCPTINPNLTFTSISCFGDQDGTASVAPAGGVGPYDILWSTAETTTSISNLAMGEHSVIVTDANGCADTTTFSITEPPQLTAFVIGTNESLPGQLDGAVDLTVAGGTPPLSFLWSNGATTEDISGLEGNGITYSVMVTDANGCQVSASTTLQTGCLPAGTSCDDGNPNTFDDVEDGNCGCAGTPCPTINPNLTFTSISCFGDQDGTAAVAPAGGVEPYDILWSTAETTTSISNLAMGDHSVIVTDANGCADTTAFSITEPPQLTASVIGTDESLPGQLDGAVDLTVAGGTPPLSFLWSNGATTEDISGLEGNGITYSVMVTDANGCQVSASTTLQTGCLPAGTSCDDGNPNTFDDVEDGNCGCAGTPCPTINPNLTFTSISCFGDQDGTASVAPAGGVGPYDILWSTAETTTSISNLTMGDHSVIVTDANGCADTTSFSITEPAQLTASVIGTDESLPGQLDGAVDLTVAGGTPPLSFLWSNGATTEDISGLEGNGITYSVMVTDANGCQVSASTTLQTGCLPAGTSCDDGNPNTFNDVEDDNCGCAGTPCPTINPNLTFTSISCFGDQDGTASVAPAGGVGPYDILWSTAETTTSISNLAMGEHSVIITDANGCADTTTFSITEPAQLTASVIGTDESLPGQLDGAVDLTVSGGTPPLSFLWSNGATTEDISGLEGNGITYSVMVTDANGCQVSASTTLQTGCHPAGTSCDDGNPNTFNDVEDGNCGCAGTPCPTINPNLTFTSISCFGDQDGTAAVAPAGGVEPYDILWSTAETSLSVSNLAMGEHSVIITDANGCADTTTFSITEPAQLTASVIGTDESLPGQLDGAVDLTVAGGTPPLSFLWSNGATTEDISGLEGNGITYSVMVTDANGCQVSASTTLQTGCHPAGTSCDDGNPNTFNDVEDGNCGCAGTPCPTINPNLTFTSISCFGDQDGTAAVAPAGGVEPYDILWSTAETSLSVSNLAMGEHSVIITDANGCADTTTFSITEPPQLTASVIGTNESLPGQLDGAVDLTVSGGTPPLSFLWSNGATTEDIFGLEGNGITYSVIVTDVNGCQVSASTTLQTGCHPAGTSCDDGNPNTFDDVEDGNCGCAGTPCPTINPNLTFTSISCFGDQDGTASVAPAGGVGPYDILWSTAETTTSISNLTMGDHSVIVTDANGCADTTSFSITEPAQLTASVIGTDESLPGQLDGAVDLTVAGGTPPLSFLWSNGATTEDISGLEGNGITYSVMVTDANGCQVSASTTLQTGCLPAGTSCDDGNPNTFNDVEDGNCGCAGTPCPTINPNLTFTSISCFGDQDGTAAVAPAGGVEPYDILWSTAETTTSISNLAMGEHSVIVTDANGCADTTTFSITEPPQLTASVIGTNESLPGQLDGAVDLTVSGGTPPLSFLWSNGATTEDIFGLEGNGITYSVIVTDVNGCQVSASTTLQTGCHPAGTSCDDGNPNTFDDVEDGNCGCAGTPCPTINPNLLTVDISCVGANDGNAYINPQGGLSPYDVTWSNGVEGEVNIRDLGPGTYSVALMDANNCTSTQQFSIGEPDSLLVEATVEDESHKGARDGTIILNPSGGKYPYFYTWSDGANSQNRDSLSAGFYEVTVSDVSGCEITQSFDISAGCLAEGTPCSDGDPTTYDDIEDGNCNCAGSRCPEIRVVADVNEISCYGERDGEIILTPEGGLAPYSYAWSVPGEGPSLQNLGPNIYGVSISDANGCQETLLIQLKDPSPLSVQHVVQLPTSSGSGDAIAQINIDGGAPPYEVFWPDGVKGDYRENLDTGTYVLQILDSNACSLVDTLMIAATCTSVGDSCDDNNPDTHSDTLDQNCNCNGIDCLPIEIELQILHPTCTYEYGSAALHTSAQGLVYNWSTGDTIQSIDSLDPGEYEALVVDSMGCRQSFSFGILPYVDLQISGSVKNESAPGIGDGSIMISVKGGTTPYHFEWSNGSTQQNVQGLAGDSSFYSVTVTDAAGCSIAETFIMSTLCPEEGNVCDDDNDQTFDDKIDSSCNCVGTPCSSMAEALSIISPNCDTELGSVLLDTMTYDFVNIQWSHGPVNVYEVTGLVVGSYSVTLEDKTGCTSIIPFEIMPFTNMEIHLSGVDESKIAGQDGSVSIDSISGGNDPFQIMWSNGSTNDTIKQLAGNQYYYVTVTDADNCIATDSFFIATNECGVLLSLEYELLSSNAICDNDGFIQFKINGSIEDLLFSIDGGKTLQHSSYFGGLTGGNYTPAIVATNAESGCSSILGEVTLGTLSSYEIRTQDPSNCTSNDGTISIEDPNLKISTSLTGPFTSKLESLYPGVYDIYLRNDQQGCVTLAGQYTLAGLNSLKVTVIKDDATCGASFGSISVQTESQNQSFSLDGQNWYENNLSFEVSPGLYDLLVQSEGCVQHYSTLTVSQLENLAVRAITLQHPTQCNTEDGSIELSVPGASEFSLKEGTPWSFEGSWKNLPVGSYDVFFRNLDQTCSGNYQVTLTAEDPSIPITISDKLDPSCAGAEDGYIAMATEGVGTDARWIWVNGHEGPELARIGAGTYEGMIQTSTFCFKEFSIELLDPAPLKISLALPDSSLYCLGQPISLSNTDSTLSYEWFRDGQLVSVEKDHSISYPGVYVLKARDSIGCEVIKEFDVAFTEEVLNANFLMASQAVAGETTQAIEISWPVPDSIQWEVSGGQIISQTLNQSSIVFNRPGVHKVMLKVMKGDCVSYVEKVVTVVETSDQLDLSLQIVPQAIEVQLFPNPNKGNFNILVDLTRESPLQVRIYNQEAHLIFAEQYEPTDVHSHNIDISGNLSGVYTMMIQTDLGWRSVSFVLE